MTQNRKGPKNQTKNFSKKLNLIHSGNYDRVLAEIPRVRNIILPLQPLLAAKPLHFNRNRQRRRQRNQITRTIVNDGVVVKGEVQRCSPFMDCGGVLPHVKPAQEGNLSEDDDGNQERDSPRPSPPLMVLRWNAHWRLFSA